MIVSPISVNITLLKRNIIFRIGMNSDAKIVSRRPSTFTGRRYAQNSKDSYLFIYHAIDGDARHFGTNVTGHRVRSSCLKQSHQHKSGRMDELKLFLSVIHNITTELVRKNERLIRRELVLKQGGIKSSDFLRNSLTLHHRDFMSL